MQIYFRVLDVVRLCRDNLSLKKKSTVSVQACNECFEQRLACHMTLCQPSCADKLHGPNVLIA